MRALIIGLGSIGERHLYHLRNNDQVEEIIAYRSGEKDDIGTYENIVEFQNLADCLSREPEFAVISNPTHKHVETAIKCALEGCHLLIEKPLSHTTDGITKLIEIIERKDLITMMGCNYRFHPALKKVKELLASEQVSDPYYFRAYNGSYLPDWRPERDYREVYSAKQSMGGGVVLDMIHEIDYAYWLFGSPERVMGTVESLSHLEIETEDIAEITVEMAESVIGSIHLDYIRRQSRRDLEIITKNGVINANLIDSYVTFEKESVRSNWDFDMNIDDTYRDQLEYFISRISRGETCQNDVVEGRNVLNVALEAKEGFQ